MTAATKEQPPIELDLRSTTSSRRRVIDSLFKLFLWISLGIALGTLMTLLIDLITEGWVRLNPALVANMPSARPERAGIQSAIFGSLWVVGTTAVISIPAGVGAAIYLEEFAKKNRWYNRLIELNVQNLASVPSVVYGILGLAFIARGFLSLGFTVMTAALILTLVVLPTVVIASREALRAVPNSLRQGSLALGATEWETVYRQVLPAAVPGIATGTILSTSRALGESAPLLLVGALTFVTFNPEGFDSPYTVLPLAIFRFISEARLEFRPLAAAASVVLLVLLLGMNSFAIFVRNRYEKKLR
ncbi:MAG: phosphate ABC transporter permease PstA [Acidimicrobiia bacterium]